MNAISIRTKTAARHAFTLVLRCGDYTDRVGGDEHESTDDVLARRFAHCGGRLPAGWACERVESVCINLEPLDDAARASKARAFGEADDDSEQPRDLDAEISERERYDAMLPHEQVSYEQEHTCDSCGELMFARWPDGTDRCLHCRAN